MGTTSLPQIALSYWFLYTASWEEPYLNTNGKREVLDMVKEERDAGLEDSSFGDERWVSGKCNILFLFSLLPSLVFCSFLSVWNQRDPEWRMARHFKHLLMASHITQSRTYSPYFYNASCDLSSLYFPGLIFWFSCQFLSPLAKEGNCCFSTQQACFCLRFFVLSVPFLECSSANMLYSKGLLSMSTSLEKKAWEKLNNHRD